MTPDPHTTASDAGWTPLERELYEALLELDRWVTEDSENPNQAKRMSGRKALVAARVALRKARGELP